MQQLFSDLWQTRTEHPFHGITSHAYLLTRPDGNILLYGTGVQEDLQAIQDLGGIVRQYLSHPDEPSWGSRVQLFAGGRKSDLKKSLGLLRELQPDVVISSASVGRSPVQMMSIGEWQMIVDGVMGRL